MLAVPFPLDKNDQLVYSILHLHLFYILRMSCKDMQQSYTSIRDESDNGSIICLIGIEVNVYRVIKGGFTNLVL